LSYRFFRFNRRLRPGEYRDFSNSRLLVSDSPGAALAEFLSSRSGGVGVWRMTWSDKISPEHKGGKRFSRMVLKYFVHDREVK
jgi:hypothetical protein